MEVPENVAIITDGNGRWAERKEMPRREGHKQGVKTLKEITRAAGRMGISYLTVYAFSTENWKRPSWEVKFLMKLFSRTISNEILELQENDVRIKVLGRRDELSSTLIKEIDYIENKTANNEGLTLNIAFNYGGRAEIVDTAQKICRELNSEEIDEETFSKFLYNNDCPDVELLIRTGGEKRISNFLLWELAYAELYFSSTYWPDFSVEDLKEALNDFSERHRRFGALDKAGDKNVKQEDF